jgi:hypothetical protein
MRELMLEDHRKYISELKELVGIDWLSDEFDRITAYLQETSESQVSVIAPRGIAILPS